MNYKGTIDQILTKLKFTELDKTKIYDIEIKEHKEKRSLNANSYAWSLLNELSLKMNIPAIDLYRKYVKDLGIYKEITINDKAVDTFIKSWSMNGIAWLCEKVDKAEYEGFSILHAYYGSSVYNSSQMARLIDNIVQDCVSVGIETLEDKKINKLIEEWEKKGGNKRIKE